MAKSAESDVFEIVGMLDKKRAVGYRSPYRLVVKDKKSLERLGEGGKGSCEVEVWGAPELLEPKVGKLVRLRGRYVVMPSQKAAPGSEAASRFVGGVIPELRRFEAVEVL